MAWAGPPATVAVSVLSRHSDRLSPASDGAVTTSLRARVRRAFFCPRGRHDPARGWVGLTVEPPADDPLSRSRARASGGRTRYTWSRHDDGRIEQDIGYRRDGFTDLDKLPTERARPDAVDRSPAGGLAKGVCPRAPVPGLR